jgi:hypothetical protein
MVIARKSLWIAMTYAALVLGLLTVSSSVVFRDAIVSTLVDPSVLFLALAVGMIPMLGGAMLESGLMDDLVENLRIGKKAFLSLSPAIVGMMPMPGGALLSAPILEKGGKEVPRDQLSAVNVWYRHILYLAYPLSSAIIVSTKIAGLDLYVAIAHLSPFLGLSLLIGYIFLLKGIVGKRTYEKEFVAKKLGVPLLVLLIAPILDFTIGRLTHYEVPEAHLALAVFVGLFLAFYLGDLGMDRVWPVAKRMQTWNFGLIIIGMFMFLNVFTASEVPELIRELEPSKVVLLVVFGPLLGFVTGRLQIPTSILIPIYLSVYAVDSMEPVTFSIMYFAVFLGYVISPVHPCISVTLEYFKADFNSFIKFITPPTVIGLVICFVAAIIFF